MERRYFLFIALSFAFMFAYSAIVQRLVPQPVRPVKPANQVAKADPLSPASSGETSGAATAATSPALTATGDATPTLESTASPEATASAESTASAEGAVTAEPAPGAPAAAPVFPETFHTLGSLDPKSGYTMLVHLTSFGAGVERIELSDGRYLELDDRADLGRDPTAYLGHLELKDEGTKGAGAEVRIVGPGSPAEKAGVKVGDRIKSFGANTRIYDRHALKDELRKFKPDDVVEIVVDRAGQQLKLSAELRRCPLQMVKPEETDPASLLMTLQTLDDDQIAGAFDEMRGVRMRQANWELMPGATIDQAIYRCTLPRTGLEIYKKFKLAPSNKKLAEPPPSGVAALGDPGAGYGLVLEVEIKNIGAAPRKVAYRLEGLSNLPTEGYWFAYKLGGFGTRDVAVRTNGRDTEIYPSNEIDKQVDGKQWLDRETEEIVYAGVDTQYFAGILIPLKAKSTDTWFQYVKAVRIGGKKSNPYLTNCNVQFASQPWTLEPQQSQSHRYLVFAGPKEPDAVLPAYDLLYSNLDVKLQLLMKYGWYPYIVQPLTYYLHFLYAIVGNFGVAIILLTATVRLCLFPFTRRQALKSAEMSEKMARVKPEQDRIMEKYKNDPVAKQRAIQELWAKHDVNPLAMLPGCFGALLQLPIFIGLYNSLRTDVELRQAPLFSENIFWCSNLAAPDMLWYWERVAPTWVTAWPLNLGPYFNLLPVISTILLYFQQKRMLAQMPGMQTPEQRKKEDELRAAGKLPKLTMEQEQQRMMQDQQKVIMTTMTFVGAILFFRFPAGLALYFITSTIWGVVERETLPKKKPVDPNAVLAVTAGPEKSEPRTGLLAALSGTGNLLAGPSASSSKDERADAERKQKRKKQGKK